MVDIPKEIVINENKEAVIEAAKEYLYNDLYFGAEVPEILKGEDKVLKLLGIK